MKKHTKKLVVSAGALVLTVGVTWLFSLTVVNRDSQQARVTPSQKYPTSDEALKTLMSGTRDAGDRDFESACIAGAIKCGKIIIEKSALPESNLDFTFYTNVPNYSSFILDDDETLDDSVTPNTQTIYTSPNGSYLVAEMPSLTDPLEYETVLSCSDPSGNSVVLIGDTAAAVINMNNAESISCTFRNIMAPEQPTACEPGDTWTPKLNFGGGNRGNAVGFSIGTKGYVGTGTYSPDLWEFDPIANTWTQKADFDGGYREHATEFTAGGKGYVTTGWDSNLSMMMDDLWEFDPIANTWTPRANLVGVPRMYATSFSIGTKGYVGTGLSYGDVNLQDLWEYDADPTSATYDTWTQKADLEGVARNQATSFSIGTKGYVGTGESDGGNLQDLWEFDSTSEVNGFDVNNNPMGDWTQKADFLGGDRQAATGFSIESKGYVGTGMSIGGTQNDFWEYDPTSEVNGFDVNNNPMGAWSPKAPFGGGDRWLAVGFSIGGKGYIATGAYGSFKKDTWEYCP